MRRALLLMLVLSLLQGALAYAALGGAPSDFGTTPLRQGGRSLAAATAGDTAAVYTVSQSTLDSGTVVREYSNTLGIVFAVSWSGPALPDLRTLLGDKFAVMTSFAGKRPKAGHSQLSVNQPDVVIVSSGHMRAYAGHAWIPSALPAGFDTAVIE